MRPAALFVLLALPLTAAPVPKAMKRKMFTEKELVGTWVYADRTRTGTYVFKADGEHTYSSRVVGGREGKLHMGTYQVVETDEPNRRYRVVLTYSDNLAMTYGWTVVNFTGDAMTFTFLNGSDRTEYSMVRAKDEK